MSFARQSVASARQLLRNQQPRRFASHAAHAEPVNESFGVRSISPTTEIVLVTDCSSLISTAQLLCQHWCICFRLRSLPPEQVHRGVRLAIVDLQSHPKVDSFGEAV
jgi:hypothetical protein